MRSVNLQAIHGDGTAMGTSAGRGAIFTLSLSHLRTLSTGHALVSRALREASEQKTDRRKLGWYIMNDGRDEKPKWSGSKFLKFIGGKRKKNSNLSSNDTASLQACEGASNVGACLSAASKGAISSSLPALAEIISNPPTITETSSELVQVASESAQMATTASNFGKALGAPGTEMAAHGKKRDVIVIGAGLSGKLVASWFRRSC